MSPEACLAIYLKVENLSIENRNYISWREQEFADEITLHDDQGKAYPRYAFSEARQVKGAARNGEVEGRDEVADVLLFRLSESVDRSSIRYFRLQLPGGAVGAKGGFRFEIPASMIGGDW